VPEGPSIVILRGEASVFEGKKVLAASGNTSVAKERLVNRTLREVRSWGKHFLLCFPKFTVRIHLLMFGSYRINSRKGRPERLSLVFSNGELNFYTCSVKIIEGPPDNLYDWEADVLAPEWNARKALRKLRANPGACVSDVLLDQDIFAGSGNIIKNEVLFRVGIHPESTVGCLPAEKLRAMTHAVREYSFDFLRWKKAFVLRKHWLVYKKQNCTRCGNKIELKYTGAGKRRTFFCPHCQRLWS
jgi:endonuclease-8